MSLVHYWPFDEESGSAVTDTVGELIGAVTGDAGDATIVDAKFGKGRDTSATSPVSSIGLYTEGANDGEYRLANWSVSLWFQLATPGAYDILNIGRYFGTGGGAGHTQVFFYASAGNQEYYLDVYYAPTEIYTTISVPTAQFYNEHLIVITGDGERVKVYLDGVEKVNQACDADLTPKNVATWISAGSNKAPGTFDDLAIWNVTLTQENVTDLWNDGAGVTAPELFAEPEPEPVPVANLIHYWPLDESAGATITDTIGGLSGTVIDDSLGDTIINPGKFRRARNLSPSAGRRYIHLHTGTSDPSYTLAAWSVSKWFNLPAPGSLAAGMFVTIGGWTNDAPTFEVSIQSWDEAHYSVFGNNNRIWTGLYGPGPTFAAAVDKTHDFLGGDIFGQTRLFTVTCDGTDTSLYLDGALIWTEPGAIALAPKTAFSFVGGDSFSGASWDGWVDDIAIWDDALTPNQVAALWNGGDGLRANFLVPLPIVPFVVNPLASYFFCLDIDDGVLDPVRIPISSWQATLQSDRSSFAQAVIPSGLDWVDAIEDRMAAGEFVVQAVVRTFDGSEQEWEAARAPLQQFFLDRGPLRNTARVVGYGTTSAGNPAIVHVLRNVRSVSVSAGGTRLRCDFDPNVRPGHTVQGAGYEIVAAYINVYANESDRYMDVGERAM